MENRGRKPCHFFKKGNCWFGDRCRYSHDTSRTNQAPCYYFINYGNCNYGNNCRYHHPLPNDPLPGCSKDVDDACTCITKSEAPSTCQQHFPNFHLHSYNRPIQNKSTDESRRRLPFVKVECGICLEEICKTAEKMYAILPNCAHSFCFSCILTWRKQNDYQTDVRTSCPTCRIVSNFILKSRDWFEGEAKEKFVSGFLERASKQHCRKFKRGNGWCRFQEKCIYKHEMYDGSQPNYERLKRKMKSYEGEFNDLIVFLEARLEVRFDDDLDIGYETLNDFNFGNDDNGELHLYTLSDDDDLVFAIASDADDEEHMIPPPQGLSNRELELIREQDHALYEEIMRQSRSQQPLL